MSSVGAVEDWGSITVGDALRRTARRYPDRIALVGGEERITFAEFDRRVDVFAAGLSSLGVRRGDHVALWMANCPTWTMTWMSCARIGAVLVPINTRFKAEEVAYILRQSDAKVLIAMDRFWNIDFEAIIREIVPGLAEMVPGQVESAGLPMLKSIVLWAPESRPGCFNIAEVRKRGSGADAVPAQAEAPDPDDPIIIVYTSGTTGHPKGAVHGHIVLKNAANVARVMRIEPGDVILGHMPFYHVAGAFTATLPALMLGCTLVTLSHWQADEALGSVDTHRSHRTVAAMVTTER